MRRGRGNPSPFSLDSYLDCFHKANEFLIEGENQKALDLYDLLITTSIDDPNVLYSIGTLYSQTGRSGLAIQFLRRALELQPDRSQAWNNLAVCYRAGGHDELARKAYERSLELNYDAGTLSNFSGHYVNAGNPDECIRLADLALELQPDLAQARTHKGLALMEKGEWAEGFKWYESRVRLPYFVKREYGVAKWEGERCGLLAIHGEQGIGDEIMFMSCLPAVLRRVERVVVECCPRLKALFERSFPGVTCYGTHDELLDACQPDKWIAMGSIPTITGFVDHVGYLKPEFIPPAKRKPLRIGVSFRGGTKQTHSHLRNWPMEWWKPLLTLDAEYYSIQHGTDETVPAKGLAESVGLIHEQEWIDDLDKLCGLIQSCDLILTVCGTAAHMGGAMNVPTWVFVPSKPAWRYGISGDRMPWYRSTRLFRQAPGEDWRVVVQRVKDELDALDRSLSRFEPTATQRAA